MGERREGARQPLQKNTRFHASQESRQEARQEDHQGWRRQAPEEGQDRVLQDLHLQGAQAGPPRDRDLLQGDVHHELLHRRHLREDRFRGRSPGALQQEAHHHLQGDPDGCAPHPPRGACQARRVRGDQGGHQVHLLRLSKQAFLTAALSHSRPDAKQEKKTRKTNGERNSPPIKKKTKKKNGKKNSPPKKKKKKKKKS